MVSPHVEHTHGPVGFGVYVSPAESGARDTHVA
jgi:hypothetical protein